MMAQAAGAEKDTPNLVLAVRTILKRKPDALPTVLLISESKDKFIDLGFEQVLGFSSPSLRAECVKYIQDFGSDTSQTCVCVYSLNGVGANVFVLKARRVLKVFRQCKRQSCVCCVLTRAQTTTETASMQTKAIGPMWIAKRWSNGGDRSAMTRSAMLLFAALVWKANSS